MSLDKPTLPKKPYRKYGAGKGIIPKSIKNWRKRMTDQPNPDVEVDVDVDVPVEESGEKYDGGEIPDAPSSEPENVPEEDQE